MDKCKYCGAISRTNYPFGRNSKSRTTFIKEHDKNCPIRKNFEKGHTHIGKQRYKPKDNKRNNKNQRKS